MYRFEITVAMHTCVFVPVAISLRSPWVKDVKLDKQNVLLSEWTLAARGFKFNWSARKLSPSRVENRKTIDGSEERTITYQA